MHTRSADDQLIARARHEAEQRGTTLNAEFRLEYAHPGRPFSREELNAR